MANEAAAAGAMHDTLTSREIAHVLDRAHHWDRSLGQRTEGITWMVWGTISAGILMTLGFVTQQGNGPLMVIGAWTPWVLAGYVLTYSIWRTAALTHPQQVVPPRLSSYVLKTAILVGFVLLLHFVVRPTTLAGPMALIGIGWIAVGLLGTRISSMGRRIGIVIGIVVFTGAVALHAAEPGMLATMLVGTAIMAAAPIMLGFYQTLTG